MATKAAVARFALFMLSIFVSACCVHAHKPTLTNLSALSITDVYTTAANLPEAEIDALQALYIATHGDYWHWFRLPGSGMPWEFTPTCNPCADAWQGINCTTVPSQGYLHVTELVLTIRNLSGTLPAEIADLSQIQVMYLAKNYLTGTIPPEIGTLQELVYFDVSTNYLSGTIPVELTNLPVIRKLDVYENYLTGTIPNEISNLLTINYLLLYDNYLSGTIPAHLNNLQSALDLDLGNNILTGTIPASIADLNAAICINLDLDTNFLTGTIPAALSNLRALNYLFLNSNHLTGSIPPQLLGDLTALLYLYIHDNQLTGSIPAELGNLYQLYQLDLRNAHLAGSIPSSISNLVNLVYLGLDSNMLTSSVPDGMKQLTKLSSLFLQSNKLSGPISQFIDASSQTALSILEVNSNRFTGQIPPDLFALPQLLVAVLGGNCFTGSLPRSICSAPQLTTLSMDGLHSAPGCRHTLFPGTSKVFVLTDYIQGGIPICLFQMDTLNTLHLSGNGLLGSLPGNVNISANLVDLALSYNKLTGSIPSVFQDRIWYNLDLSYNKLTGTLSSAFATVPGNLSVMAHLGLAVVNGTSDEYSNPYGATVLRNNRLSRAIPAVFDSMQNVSILRGNVFECALDQHDLPQHDGGASTYSCGSSAFNVPYYIYLGAMFVGVCVAIAVYVLSRESLETATSWMNVVQRYEANVTSNSQDRPLLRYKYVLQLLDAVCLRAAWCTLYILVVGLPLYALLSQYYGTHADTYAWAVSAAYLSGATPLALHMVFLCVLLALLLTLCESLVQHARRCGPRETKIRAQDLINTASVAGERLGIYAALFLANTVVVGGANVGFVLAATDGTALAQALAQIALSIFKLSWSNFGLIYLMRWAQQRLSAKGNTMPTAHAFFGLQLFVQLYNLIVVPCIVTAFLSPDCFNSLIVPASTVTTHFSYALCTVVATAKSECVQESTVFASSSYDPPFTYSYQCSSSLVTFYAPTFVYTGLIATFVNPALSMAQRAIYIRVPPQSPWMRVLQMFVPRIQRPSGPAEQRQRNSTSPTTLCGRTGTPTTAASCC